eukprot:m.516979 g.516979  ORF g.516979 m.516979 type:complete len:60 (+) comp21934_c0_seq3:2964-3143(+)
MQESVSLSPQNGRPSAPRMLQVDVSLSHRKQYPDSTNIDNVDTSPALAAVMKLKRAWVS